MTAEFHASDLGGQIFVRIARRGRNVERVHIRSTRPFHANRLLADKRTSEALTTVPLLFGVCRHAQSSAARNAMSAARASADLHHARPLSVLLETLQEHFSHILIDVPRAMGRESTQGCVADVRRRIVHATLNGVHNSGAASLTPEFTRALQAAATREIYGEPPSEWLGLDGIDAVRAWAKTYLTSTARIIDELLDEDPTLGESGIALMPDVQPQALRTAVVHAMSLDAQFEAAPTWDGVPVETGALARLRDHPLVRDIRDQYGNSSVARMVARMAELALLLQALTDEPLLDAELRVRVQSFALAPGEGVGAVQTARGLLLHRVRVNDDRVADYRIVAPTEWNFHPAGSVVHAIGGLAADTADDLRRRAELTVRVIDPCVDCDIEIDHA